VRSLNPFLSQINTIAFGHGFHSADNYSGFTNTPLTTDNRHDAIALKLKLKSQYE
jgi:hypothetical protein